MSGLPLFTWRHVEADMIRSGEHPMSHDFAPCEVNDRIDDGPWVPCPRLGRLCLRWNAEIGEVEEEYLCAEHEKMMYSCQECGEPKGTWRGQYCDDCRNLDAQGTAEDGDR